MKSFDPEDTEYLDYLKKYGFCVVKILSEKDCDESVEALFEEFNSNPKQRQKIEK